MPEVFTFNDGKKKRPIRVEVEKDKVTVVVDLGPLEVNALVITGKDLEVYDWWGWGD